MMEEERRRSMQWANDCHRQLRHWRCFAYDVVCCTNGLKSLGGVVGVIHWAHQLNCLWWDGGA